MSESSLLAVTVAAGVLAPGPHVIRPAPRRTPAAAAADAAASRKDASVRKVFQAELHQVGEELIQIATLVREALARAKDALLDADIQLAEEVISNDARIDFLQNDLDERSIDILALQSPVASDLRMIVGALRMSASLERAGDLARHLAQAVRIRYPEPVIPEPLVETFTRMFDLDLQILDRVIQVLQTRDPPSPTTSTRSRARSTSCTSPSSTRSPRRAGTRRCPPPWTSPCAPATSSASGTTGSR
jgi:Na+/phosphate symporter